MNSRRTPIAIILLFAFSLTLNAAELGDWMSVQSVPSGTRIRVIQTGGARLEGRFQSATDGALIIGTARQTTLAKEQVIRVDRRPGWSRKKRALVGAAIGLVAGGVVAAGVAARLNNEGAFSGGWAGVAVGVSLVGGAGIGAGVGALTGGGTSIIYRRP